MSHAKKRNTRRIVALSTVGGVVCAGVVVAGAFAGQSSPEGQQPSGADATTVARTLVTQLGTEKTAGSWIGSDGKPVVAVTDSATAAAVRKAGATPKMVTRSGEQLAAATAVMKAAPRVAGTAWSVNPKTNQVVVLADKTVSASDWDMLSAKAATTKGAVRMQRTAGTFTTKAAGGDAIFSDSARCSLGFNVTDGQKDFILTAGHCGPQGTPWSADQQGSASLGQTVKSTFPGDGDFSLIDTEGTSEELPSEVTLGNGQTQPITSAKEAVVGEKVTRSGSTTGVHEGTVQALDATVNYPEGTVTGLIQTDVCAEPGDSGGSLFDGDAAIGLTSGGDGDCTVGGTTFFQPVTTALQALGVQIPGDGGSAGSGAGAGSGDDAGAGAGADDSASASESATASAPPAESGAGGADDGASATDTADPNGKAKGFGFSFGRKHFGAGDDD